MKDDRSFFCTFYIFYAKKQNDFIEFFHRFIFFRETYTFQQKICKKIKNKCSDTLSYACKILCVALSQGIFCLNYHHNYEHILKKMSLSKSNGPILILHKSVKTKCTSFYIFYDPILNLAYITNGPM